MKKSKSRPVSDNTSIQSRVHALAWAGKHAQAISLATQELDKPNLPPSLQMDLLDLRSESYIAQYKLDLAFADALAMEKLAKTTSKINKNHAFISQALRRKGAVQIQMEDLKGAVKNINSALKAASQTGQEALIGQALLHLGMVESSLGKDKVAVVTLKKAIAIFQEQGDTVKLAHAYHSLSGAYFSHNTQNAFDAAQTALNLGQQTGDQLGIGHAHLNLAHTINDLAEQIKHFQQATLILKRAGYEDLHLTAMSQLGACYQSFGLYSCSSRLVKNTIELQRATQQKWGLFLDLANIVQSENALGRYDSARQYLQESAQILSHLNDPFANIIYKFTLGDFEYLKGNFNAAIQQYQNAREIALSIQYTDIEISLLSQIGKCHLGNKDPLSALNATTKAANLHQAASFIKINGFTRQEVWWRHTQALIANGKLKEADAALDRAYGFLLEGIRNVRDVGLRRCFLNKIEDHRELLQRWLNEGKKRKLPQERLYSYLHIESNTREPFARLTDTSQRLNALKTIPEIQVFLMEEATELSGGERVMLILEDGKELKVAESILPKGEEADKVLISIKKHLTSARLKRTVQLILPNKHGLSRIIAPLIAQNQIIGYLYADMDSIYGLFDEIDRDMLGMLVNQAAVALDNAGLTIGKELVYQDHLTGVFNRRYFDERLQKLLEVATKDESSVSLLDIDMDNFKYINDTYGHSTGDSALKALTDCMKNNSRKHDLVCRLGGDEFALVLVNTPGKAALQRAEKLCEEIRRHTVGNAKKQTTLTISVGVASFPHQAITPSNLLELADIALYNAKTDGRNCARAYDAST